MRLRYSLPAALVAISLAGLTACTSDSNFNFDAGPAATATETLSGSYARLLTVGDFLYAVDNSSVITYDISDRDAPAEVGREEVGLAIETIYHNSGNLFIGSREGMFTYTITDNGTPRRRGQFNYSNLPLNVEPCDPVVADENTAYATLYTDVRGAGPCGRTETVQTLVVMDVTSLDNPTLISTYDVLSPRGLALDGNTLFVCNDFNGFTVLDVTNPAAVEYLTNISTVEAWDAIVQDDVLMIVGTSELIQYDVSNPAMPVELSRLPLPRT